jgi:hypothetical protein
MFVDSEHRNGALTTQAVQVSGLMNVEVDLVAVNVIERAIRRIEVS